MKVTKLIWYCLACGDENPLYESSPWCPTCTVAKWIEKECKPTTIAHTYLDRLRDFVKGALG